MVSGCLWSLPAQNLFFLLPVTAPRFPFSKSPHLYFHLVWANPGFLAPGISDQQTQSQWLVQGRLSDSGWSQETQFCAFATAVEKEVFFLPEVTRDGSLELLGITMWSKSPREWTNSENRKAEKWRERDIPESVKLFNPSFSCVWRALYLFHCANNTFLFSP